MPRALSLPTFEVEHALHVLGRVRKLQLLDGSEPGLDGRAALEQAARLEVLVHEADAVRLAKRAVHGPPRVRHATDSSGELKV